MLTNHLAAQLYCHFIINFSRICCASNNAGPALPELSFHYVFPCDYNLHEYINKCRYPKKKHIWILF